MIDRARDWWMGRSERERWMLGVMFALIGVLILWLAIIRPIDSARTSAQLRLDAATTDAGRIAAVAEGVRRARVSTPPALTGTLAATVGQAAEANGFTLARLDPQANDRVTIAISTARSPALFTWLGVLEKQGVIVDKLTLRTNSDATLAVEGVLRVRGR
jgi:general secretion pathway protein M